ncbi:multicopper oxidase family protein [Aurantiacibacter sp. MUD61]|uniref:multicopper oxidase family protein n=1 Tax=Aurantiacibacter sp. MUD61 TaxID=3009083 RepID=UPI0022F02B03|nr:multicopper oxidase family protein [Aurantiacibacter sp. MUD61]
MAFTATASAQDAEQRHAPSYEVNVERVQGTYFNPWTGEMDRVELRAFRGEENTRFIAPTLRVRPGQVLRLGVQNDLADCSAEQIARAECFNSTNIHTHGLWVSPSGNSDNVMISINPGERFNYEFAIPEDHPAGTFWYHPHMHGATSIQLGSGMAGALIIEGDRIPTNDMPGDIDILLQDQSGERFGEQIMVFSQIQYGCFDDEGQLNAPRSPDPEARPWEHPAWQCEGDDVGSVDSWRQFGPANEMTSGRLLSVNGEMQPTIGGLETGRFQRLRMIHAGLRRSVRMTIRRLADDAPPLRSVLADQQRAWILEHCTGEIVEQFHFADDGLTRPALRPVSEANMYPGSRYDSLVYFAEPGSYCMINDQTWRMQPDERRMVGILQVAGESAEVPNIAAHLVQTLEAAAETQIADQDIRSRVLSDLNDGMQLGAFTWHEPVADDELTGHQTATMSIEEIEGGGAILSIDGSPYQHGRIDRTLMLGDVEEWEITSNLGSHPFHIHVNPFQIVSVIDEEGRDVTVEGSDAFDRDYAGMIGSWRDTVIIKQGYTVRMRTRYRRYVGDFVLHCHFASHGDEGMMQGIRVVLPGDQTMGGMPH